MIKPFYDLTKFPCNDPIVLHDRSTVLLCQRNGYYYNGRFQRLSPDLDEDEIYKYFNPHNRGIWHWKNGHDSTDGFEIDVNLLNAYWTYDFLGHIKPLYLLLPCRHCSICKIKQSNILADRLDNEAACYDRPPLFVTLTYKNEFLPPDGVDKDSCQKFLKRLKHFFPNFRYYLVSEYGKDDYYVTSLGEIKQGTFRPHYHLLLFGIDYSLEKPSSIEDVFNKISKSWYSDRRKKEFTSIGRIDVKPCSSKGVFYYVSKYILKQNNVPYGKNPNFRLFSNKPGIGGNILTAELNRFYDATTRDNYTIYNRVFNTRKQIRLSSYYLRKIYPSFSSLLSSRVRRLVVGVRSTLRDAADFGYNDMVDISKKFYELLKPLEPFGYGVFPLSYKDIKLINRHRLYSIDTVLNSSTRFMVFSKEFMEKLDYLRDAYKELLIFMNNFDEQQFLKKMENRFSYLNNFCNCCDRTLLNYNATRLSVLHNNSIKI